MLQLWLEGFEQWLTQTLMVCDNVTELVLLHVSLGLQTTHSVQPTHSWLVLKDIYWALCSSAPFAGGLWC